MPLLQQRLPHQPVDFHHTSHLKFQLTEKFQIQNNLTKLGGRWGSSNKAAEDNEGKAIRHWAWN